MASLLAALQRPALHKSTAKQAMLRRVVGERRIPAAHPAHIAATPLARAGAAASAPGATPAEAFVQQLGQPFLEQRVAVYRCLAALAARDWAAGQACAHSPLLDHLLDPTTEASKQGCEWRHACVVALAATIEDVRAGGLGADGPHAAALTAAADRVEAAARAGPYGAGRAGPAEHVVATMPGA